MLSKEDYYPSILIERRMPSWHSYQETNGANKAVFLNERALRSVCIQEEVAEQSLITEPKREKRVLRRHKSTIQPTSSQPRKIPGAAVNKK
jgi:hypothetical protein